MQIDHVVQYQPGNHTFDSVSGAVFLRQKRHHREGGRILPPLPLSSSAASPFAVLKLGAAASCHHTAVLADLSSRHAGCS